MPVIGDYHSGFISDATSLVCHGFADLPLITTAGEPSELKFYGLIVMVQAVTDLSASGGRHRESALPAINFRRK